MFLFFFCSKDLAESRVLPNANTFSGLYEYFMIGLPLLFVLILDYWGWEYMTLASGFIGINEQAA